MTVILVSDDGARSSWCESIKHAMGSKKFHQKELRDINFGVNCSVLSQISFELKNTIDMSLTCGPRAHFSASHAQDDVQIKCYRFVKDLRYSILGKITTS